MKNSFIAVTFIIALSFGCSKHVKLVDRSIEAGYQARCVEITRMLDGRAEELSQNFNFDRLVEGHRLPAVIEETTDLAQIEGNLMIKASRRFKIVAPSRFVLEAPTFRSYFSCLGRSASKLKSTDDELFSMGREQADAAFKIELFRLKAEYKGMLLARSLERQNVLDPTDVRVKGSEIVVKDDQVLFELIEAEETSHDKFSVEENWTPLAIESGE